MRMYRPFIFLTHFGYIFGQTCCLRLIPKRKRRRIRVLFDKSMFGMNGLSLLIFYRVSFVNLDSRRLNAWVAPSLSHLSFYTTVDFGFYFTSPCL